MVNQSAHQSLFSYSPASSSASNFGASDPLDLNSASVEKLLVVVREQPVHRDEAIYILSKKRENCKEMALALWHSHLIVTILLQEIIGVYRHLTPMRLSKRDTDRACNALTLFMHVASCKETRMPFLQASMLVYVYPFLTSTETDQQTEFLKLTSLGVIVSLVKDNDPEAVHFLLETGVFPKCLHCMEHGSEKSKILATRVISKILTHKEGVLYCCESCDNMVLFYSAANIMAGMIDSLDKASSKLLLKHIINCYLKFSSYHRTANALKQILPSKLTNSSFMNMMLDGETESIEKLNKLLLNIQNA